jgi:outer membrane autotransporter protein
LNFNILNEDNTYQIEANAASFTTVSTNNVQLAVAEHMDNLLPSATGDLSNVLGEFQTLPSSEFSTAFSSLSPDSYDNSTRATLDVAEQSTKALQLRMSRVRSDLVAARDEDKTSADSLMLAYNGSLAGLGELTESREQRTKSPYGLWADAFGQYGDQDGKPGFTGFHYLTGGTTLGFDRTFANNLIGGISADYAYTDIDLDADSGDGTIQSIGASVYGSYFNEQSYVEGVLSYANQQYDNKRHIVVGAIRRTADSDHSGNAFSACIAGGHDFLLHQWELGPFASLQYVFLDEEGFQESGAGTANLSIGGRKTDSLVSELGVRAGRTVETKLGKLVPELSAAWVYDFDIDDRTINASFAGTPVAPFSIRGQDVERCGAKIGAGATLIRQNGLSARLKYNAEFREDYIAHAVIGGVRYDF